jgi:hypothetical protein
VTAWRRQLRVRLWIVSLALFVAGFAGRVAANVWIDNVAWSYPIEVDIQWYAYLAGLAAWVAWLALQATPRLIAPGCLVGVALTVASLFAVVSSILK